MAELTKAELAASEVDFEKAMKAAGLRGMVGDIRALYPERARSKKVRTPEEVAKMPVYIRLTKAQVECLEDHIRDEGLIGATQILTPAILLSYFVGIFAKYGVDWSKTRTTLRNPTLIRK